MPKISLFDALRGPWTLEECQSEISGPADLLFPKGGEVAVAALPSAPEHRNELIRVALQQLPNALHLLESFADVQNDTRVSVDGRYFCLWCNADLGHPDQATGAPDDVPDEPDCMDPACIGNAARALLVRLEIIADCESTLHAERSHP